MELSFHFNSFLYVIYEYMLYYVCNDASNQPVPSLVTKFWLASVTQLHVFAEPLADPSSILRRKIQGDLGFGLVCWFFFKFPGRNALEKAAITIGSAGGYFTSELTHSCEYCAAEKERPKESPYIFWIDKPVSFSCVEQCMDFFLKYLLIFCHVICYSNNRRYGECLQTITQGAGSLLFQWSLLQMRICLYSFKR